MIDKRIRIIEIDATPTKIPSEVEVILKPVLQREDCIGFEMKAGELYDADYPQSHSSFYVAVRYDVDQTDSTQAADLFLHEVTTLAINVRLPVIEIHGDHREFTNLAAEFGW